MADTVINFGGASPATSIVSQNTSASATTIASATTATATQNAATASPQTNNLYADPITGVLITEELDPNGHVTAQNPANFVLAYLRNGLTADGEPKVSASA